MEPILESEYQWLITEKKDLQRLLIVIKQITIEHKWVLLVKLILNHKNV